jgi:hypothetical protein
MASRRLRRRRAVSVFCVSVPTNFSVVLGRRIRPVSTMRRFGNRPGGRGRSATASVVGIGVATPIPLVQIKLIESVLSNAEK